MHSAQTNRLYCGLDAYAELLGRLSTARGITVAGTKVTTYIMFRGEVDPVYRDWCSHSCVIVAYAIQPIIYKYTQAVKHRLHEEI